MTHHNGQLSQCDWRTPKWILDGVRAVFGDEIDMDPATAPDNPTRANRFYTDGGLEKPWSSENLFVNPPWSKLLRMPPLWWWLTLVHQWVEDHPGHPAIVVVPASTNAVWFHDWIFSRATDILLPRGRVAYDAPPGRPDFKAPSFDTAVVMFGACPESGATFREAFDGRGRFGVGLRS